MTTYQEAPEIADAITYIVARWGGEDWFVSALQTTDDAGPRIEVQVSANTYLEDVLPRKIRQAFLVVRKVDTTATPMGVA